MAHTPEPQPPTHTPAAVAATATATARPRIRDQLAQNPLASFLGAVIIVMLGFTLTTSYDRITRLEDKIDARFAAQDQKIDTRFDSLESDVGEINLKLTALIAALNATDAADAALEGRLTGAGAADPADEAR